MPQKVGRSPSTKKHGRSTKQHKKERNNNRIKQFLTSTKQSMTAETDIFSSPNGSVEANKNEI